MTKIAATAKRQTVAGRPTVKTIPPMSECIQVILGCAYDVEDLPLHMQALIAVGDGKELLTDPKDRRLFGAGFILALQLANIGTTLINNPKLKDSVTISAVKKAVAEAKTLILGTGPAHTGAAFWDRVNDIFWHGKHGSNKKGAA